MKEGSDYVTRYPWKYTENGCPNIGECEYRKDGICQKPEIPTKKGCSETWLFYVRRLYKWVERYNKEKEGGEIMNFNEMSNKMNGNKKAYFDLLPTVLNGISGYIVYDWKNILDTDGTPLKYRIGDGAYFVSVDNNREILIIDELNTFRYIRRGDFISKELWKNYLSIMIQAGHRLTQILREERRMVRFEI